jgi:oligopeptidase B
MRRWQIWLGIGFFLGTAAPASASPLVAIEAPAPPVARMAPTRLESHGHVRIDEYYWLNQRENPEVIDYLKAENAYAESVLAPTRDLQERLFQEIVGRIKKSDDTVPYRVGDSFYYTRFEGDGEYPIYCRKRGSLEAPEEVLLDANPLAAGHGYFAVRGGEVSSGQNFLAVAVDTVGRRFYTIRIKDLDTGQILPEVIPNTTPNLVWAEDNRNLFYAKQDSLTLRWYRVYRHTLGRPAAQDDLVYEERDSTFGVSVKKTQSRKYLLITSEQTLSTEVRYVEAMHPEEPLRGLEPRGQNHEYGVNHVGDFFVIRSNLGARNFRLLRAPEATPSRDHWEEILPNREDVFLQGFQLFRDYLVTVERSRGLTQLHIRPWNGDREHTVDFGEPAYSVDLGDNHEPDSRMLRFVYTSLTTPESIYDYDMETREKTLRKRQEVLGGYDPANYRTERLWAPAGDGTHVPISLVYRQDLRRPAGNPLLLYGYGSYGYSTEARFNAPVISLLDRGFVYAIAHVRGGQEMGRAWYEDGKLFHKRNTFTDFIDCAKYLVRKRYADPQRTFAQGGSAGGLLMGAVINLRPDLFTGVVAQVPFVDVVTTMLDPSIPLTTGEYDEWGDPNREDSYEYMLGYSPYDNVKARDYPNLLVTTGLQDSQVQYWEPAKWVARLRRLKTDHHRLLLVTNMEAGHSGASGRFRRHRETARTWAFLLDLAGIRN